MTAQHSCSSVKSLFSNFCQGCRRYGGSGGSCPRCPDGIGAAQGQVMPFSKNLSGTSAISKTFDLLSFCHSLYRWFWGFFQKQVESSWWVYGSYGRMKISREKLKRLGELCACQFSNSAVPYFDWLPPPLRLSSGASDFLDPQNQFNCRENLRNCKCFIPFWYFFLSYLLVAVLKFSTRETINLLRIRVLATTDTVCDAKVDPHNGRWLCKYCTSTSKWNSTQDPDKQLAWVFSYKALQLLPKSYYSNSCI